MNVVVLSSFNTPSNRLGVMIAARPSIITPAARALRPLTQLRCSLRSAARGAAPVAAASGRLLVKAPPAGRLGVGGALSLLPDVVELATIEPGVRADLATQGGSTFTFDLRALIARTRPLEWPGAPPARASAGVVRRRVRTALEGPQIARFSPSLRLAGLAPSASPRGSPASLLLAAPHAPAPLGSLMRLLLLGRGGIEHRTLRCCNFHSVLLLPLPLCACQALAAWA